MWKKGNLDRIIVIVDGDEIVISPYGEAWIQESEGLPLHPLAMSIIWVALQGVLDETIPKDSEETMHRVLTALSISLSYDYSVLSETMQATMDKLLATSKPPRRKTRAKKVRAIRNTKSH